MSPSVTLSVVVPLYCEEATVEELHRRLSAVLEASGAMSPAEILYVDDGSTDATWDLVQRIAAADDRVRALRLSRNFGHQVAITAGMDASRGRAVVLMDGDLQDPPEVIDDLVRKWRDGCDVVYGRRGRRRAESGFKRLTARLFYRAMRFLSETDLPLDSGDFRLLDRRVVDALGAMREDARYLRGMVSWVGFRQEAVEYERDARYAGTTKYSLRKMTRLAMNGVTSFSSRPLLLSAQFGFLVTLVALAGAVWVLLGRILDPTTTVPGWTSVLLVVLFLGGVQLISLGVLGAYLARVFDETKRRPLYFISETAGESARGAGAGPRAGRDA